MTRVLYFGVIFLALACSAVYIGKPLSAAAMHGFGDLVPVVASLLALVLMTCAITTFSKRDKQRLGWILLTVGIGLYFLGEVSWAYMELVTGIEVPYPSLADFFWLAGYAPLFIGLLLIYRSLAVKLSKHEKLAFIALSLFMFIPTLFLLFVPIISSTTISQAEKYLDLIYPTWDMFLALPALATLLIYGRGLLGRTWLFISLGFLLITLADLGFSYLTWIGVYKTGNLIDLLWIFGYAWLALAAVHQMSLIRESALVGAGTG